MPRNLHHHLQRQQSQLAVKLSSSLNHQDTIDAPEIEIGRLEEDYYRVERELEALEEAINSTGF